MNENSIINGFCRNSGPTCWHAAMTNLCDGCRANIYALLFACAHPQHQHPISGFSHLNHSLIPTFNHVQGQHANELTKTYEDEMNSWLLPNPDNNEDQRNYLLSHEVDRYLNLENYSPWTEDQLQANNMQQFGNNQVDAVVPVQFSMQETEQQQQHIHNFLSETEHNASTFSFINPPPSSMTDSAFTGTVTDSFSNTYNLPLQGAFDQFFLPLGEIFGSNSNFGLFPCAVSATQFGLPPMSRKEKVLRYLEKKKARKFSKKITYTSRKTYAKTRHRVKGRFARKSELDQDSFHQRA